MFQIYRRWRFHNNLQLGEFKCEQVNKLDELNAGDYRPAIHFK